MSSNAPPPADALALGPELTISQAAGVRDALVDALCATAGDLQLDLGAVSEIDSAGVQLLLAARRSVAERGATLTLVATSAPVAEALAVFGLDPTLEPLAHLAGADA